MKDYETEVTVKIKLVTPALSVHRAVVQAEDEAIKTIRAIFPKAEITARAIQKKDSLT